jgi:hypothetical protein
MSYKVKFENGQDCEWEKKNITFYPKSDEGAEQETLVFFTCVQKRGSHCKVEGDECKTSLTEGKEEKTYKCSCQSKDKAVSGGDYVYLEDGEKCQWKENPKVSMEWACEGDACKDKNKCNTRLAPFNIWFKEGDHWYSKLVHKYICICESE